MDRGAHAARRSLGCIARCAFEVNRARPTPSEQFIRLAKALGVKFTIGSDDATPEDYGGWGYNLTIQQKVGLGWRDM